MRICERYRLKVRKPVRRPGQTGFLGYGGKPSTLVYHLILNLSFKILSGHKLYGLRFRYSNLLQRLWVYSLSRLPLHHFERPETDELNHLVFPYTRLN
jgi:hypothetical protein